MRTSAAIVLAGAALVLAGCGGGGSVKPKITQPPKTASLVIHLKGGKPVGGIQRLSVKAGTPTNILVYTDVKDELHLHGYDKHLEMTPAPNPWGWHFDPNVKGVFVIELEHRGLQIGELTVT